MNPTRHHGSPGDRVGGASTAVALVALLALALGTVTVAVTRTSSAAERSAAGCPAEGTLEPEATVAIVDSGVAPGVAPGRVPAERIDLTGARSSSLDPHGSAMASIVARGAPAARILDVRVLDGNGAGTAAEVADGIDAARRSGAAVINLSAAIPPTDGRIRAALDRAHRAGAIVVIAAGNDGRDLDHDEDWRALAAAPCTVVVGATDRAGRPLASSNRGGATIDAWAIGASVSALDTTGRRTRVTGTSPAAASITAALVGTA